MFNPDLPKDIVKCDEIRRPPGLVQGGLTNDQIATKVAREFFQRPVDKNYDKAGLIYSGIPASEAKKLSERIGVSRVVEVGKPVAGMHPDPTPLAVTVKVECGAQVGRGVFAANPAFRQRNGKKGGTTIFRVAYPSRRGRGPPVLDAGVVFEGFSGKNADKLKDFFENYRILFAS